VRNPYSEYEHDDQAERIERALVGLLEERLEDALTDPATADLFTDAQREEYVSGTVFWPRSPFFLGLFHAACDDTGLGREDRGRALELVFGPEPSPEPAPE
jgi:hypothetical protein